MVITMSELPEPMDATGERRWWRWAGRTIDLLGDTGTVPGLVRAAILAHRDAQDRDMAEFLIWIVGDHPPWSGGCTTCGTRGVCTVQANAHGAITSWLVHYSNELMARLNNAVSRREAQADA